MSNENINVQDEINEEVNEVAVEAVAEEILEEVQEETQENLVVEKKSANKEKNPLLIKLGIGLIDQFVIISASLVLMVIGDLILKLLGFQIVSAYRVSAYLISYIITNVLYGPVCMLCKFKTTIAGKILTE